MAKDRWVIEWSYGYVGTDNSDVIDIGDVFGLTPEEVEKMTDEEAGRLVNEYVWELAIEQVETYSRPAREGEVDCQSVEEEY